MFSSYSKNFWIISFAMLMFMVSFNLIIPELNEFIRSLGGESYKGLIIALFTISAGISRPFSGKLADTIGRRKVMIIGITICIIVSLLYSLSTSVFFFLLLRFLHGFSTGFLPTGATALVTDILPANKRGEGMGIWGTFMSLGIGIGQSSGSYINIQYGIEILFMISAAFAGISAILIGFVKETLKNKKSFHPRLLKINIKDVFEPEVIPSSIVMFLTAPASGIIFVLSPEMSTFLELENKGWFFGFYVISTILVRLFTGKLSDKIGRRQTLLLGTSILLLSLILTGMAQSVFSFTLASIIFGIATGISSPTLFAWTADLSPEDRRGVGAGTMFIALEFGIMLGAISTMFTYNNTPETIFTGFSVGIGLTCLSIIYLIWHLKRRTSAT